MVMHAPKPIRTFTEQHPYIGPLFWILSVQYFIAQVFAAAYWHTPFNIRLNPISDLGNTECTVYAGRYVCSPLHTWMNASFIVLGITIVIGSVLLYQGFKKTRHSRAGFYMMSLAGIGAALVGLFPENSVGLLHSLGAFLVFLFGNLALVVLGLSLEMPRSFRWFTVGFGIFALIALALFATGNYLWFGFGGMERLTAYPQTIWLIVFGVYVSAHRYSEHRQSKY